MAFDPDAYLKSKETPDFDPDAYLSSKGIESEPKTLAGKVVSKLREVAPFPASQSELAPLSAKGDSFATTPLKPLEAVEKYGGKVRETALAPIEKGMDTIAAAPAKAGYPKLGAAAIVANELFGKPMLRAVTPFTPSEFGALGSLAMVNENPDVLVKVQPKIGKAYVEDIIPSTPEQIRHSQRVMSKDAADLVIERPHLGNSRAEILENSKTGISNLEKAIQEKIMQTAEKGRVKEPITPNDEFTAAQEKLKKPFELPSGKGIERFKEPEVGTIQGYSPEELNLKTPGKNFTKGNSQGLFQPEDPKVEARQIEYLKRQRDGEVLKAREAFQKRMSDPEYAYGIKKEYAIGKDDIAKGFDKVIGKFSKTGTEDETVSSLERMKYDFVKKHPQWADLQYWNDIKRSIYDLVGDRSYVKQNTTAKVQALKAVANNIKSSIEKVAPGIKQLNDEQGALLNIRDAIIQSSPKEVRSASLTAPLKERVAISGGRALSKTRTIPGAPGWVGLLAHPSQDQDQDGNEGLFELVNP